MQCLRSCLVETGLFYHCFIGPSEASQPPVLSSVPPLYAEVPTFAKAGPPPGTLFISSTQLSNLRWACPLHEAPD